MKITLDFDNAVCRVEKERGDKTYNATEWSSAESQLLYHVKQKMIEQGFDVIKKRMWKDGHLVDDDQLYIRTRKWNNALDKNQFCVYNSNYAIYDAGLHFNEYGEVSLMIY